MVVRNVSRREIRSARVLIEVYGRDGTLQLATTGLTTSKCCTVLGLPPGQEYGLYLPTALSPAHVGRVAVRTLRLRSRAWHGERSARATATRARINHNRRDVVVTARVRTRGPASPYVVGQAFLADRSGRLRAVISGRYYCFGPARQRVVRMHLTYSAPPGTVVRKVVAYPIPPNARTLVGRRCH